MIMKILILVSLFAGTTLPAHRSSTNVPLNNLSLEQAIELALRAHPHLLEAAANLESAKARAAAAGRLPNPEIVGRMESAPISAGTASNAEYVAGFSQTIPLGKRLSAARDVEKAGVDLREKEREAAAWNLIRSVRGAFATALFTARVLQAQTNLAADLEELLRITRVRVEQGDAAPLDLARFQAEAAQQKLEVKEAHYLHREAMHALSAALGDFRIKVESLEGNLEDALEVAAIKAGANQIADNPNLAVLESAADAQRARVHQAKTERIPDVNLDLLYRRLQGSREKAFDVGVRIPIPVFDRKRGRVREAQSEHRAVEARLERTRIELGLELRSRELALERALDAVSVMQSDLLPKLETSLRGAEARYAAGDTSLSDLLAVRREAAIAQLQYLEALRTVMEAWMIMPSRTVPP
jgi:outer membrane protein, heavy metal efflux system